MEKRRYYEDNPAADQPNHFDLPEWVHPRDYGGHSPVGDYLIYSRSRDSETLDNVNYETILERLESAYEQTGDDEEANAPYDFRVNHWAVGWVEYIIVPRSAPREVQEEAYAILGSLANYPCLDDGALSEAELNDSVESWENWAQRDVENEIESNYRFGYVGTGDDETELELYDAAPLVNRWLENNSPDHETHSDGPHFNIESIAQDVVDDVDNNPYSFLHEHEDWFVWQVALTA